MKCVVVPLLLKRNVGLLFGVLRSSRSNAFPPPFFWVLCFCIAVMFSCFHYAVF
jgi:hypothetical protein